MTLFTSEKFASSAAEGADWREISKKVLEDLSRARTKDDGFNFGFLYVSDHLTAEAGSILTLFRSVTEINDWVGCVGLGVCGTGREYFNRPAVAAMIGRFDTGDYKIFSATESDSDFVMATLDPWLDNRDPMLCFVHGDPATDHVQLLKGLENRMGGFWSGGISSSRGKAINFAEQLFSSGTSGVVFSQEVETAIMVSQGCVPIGPAHTVTRCEDNVVVELDGERAFDVFAKHLKELVSKKTSQSVEKIEMEGVLPLSVLSSSDDKENKNFEGEIYAALPVPGSDQEDYMVRHILGFSPEDGSIAIAHNFEHNDRVMFVHRDQDSVMADLSHKLLDLRERVIKDKGEYKPQGAIYISCMARAIQGKESSFQSEMALIKEIVGDVPLAGFHANGEISNNHLYEHAGVLIVFV